MIIEQTQNEFIRNFLVPNYNKLDFFLGAGASIQAGIPTGSDFTWMFKRDLYCTEQDISKEKFKDIQSPRNQKILQEYFDSKDNYPKLYDDKEYSFYFGRCYTTVQARQSFIANYVDKANPSLGHLCLANFIINNKIENVWTTNFDKLVESGVYKLNPAYSLNIVSSANKSSLGLISNNDYPSIYKLHGDFRYDEIQNTEDELKELETTLANYFVTSMQNRGLVVIGYSGKDDSIMNILETHINDKDFLSKGIYWIVQNKTLLSNRVRELLEKVYSTNKPAFLVEISDFDDFMYSMYKQYENKNDVIDNEWKDYQTKKLPIAFSSIYKENSPLILNTFKCRELPQCKAFKTDIKTWKQLNSIINDKDIIAGLYSDMLYTFEEEDVIHSIFNEHILSEISTNIPPQKDLYKNDNSVYIGMLYKLIKRNLTKRGAIEFDRNKFYMPNINDYKDNFENLIKYLAIQINLSFVDNNLFLHIRPTYYLTDRNNNPINDSIKLKKINYLMSNLYNNRYFEEFKNLYRYIAQKDKNEFLVKFCSNNYELVFDGLPISNENSPENNIAKSFIFPEPIMLFSEKDRDKNSVNQIKGIAKYGPIDFSYADENIARHPIRLAILTPKSNLNEIIAHLNKLTVRHASNNNEFLTNYEGFSSIYKRELQVPSVQDKNLIVSYDYEKIKNYTTEEFLKFIKNQIDLFSTKRSDFDVLILYVPQILKNYREDIRYDADYNLHDAIKLYATDKGVRIQIVEERSLNASDECKLMWALSTSIYAKASGVLWHPEILNDETAFIGISYAQSKNNGTCIGCSQLFDSSGTGMRLVLQKINDPLFFTKNSPYMKREEARRALSCLREEYNKSARTGVLNRVVIHKTTPFTQEEKIGITQAFSGVNDIEMLQIQELTPWRAIRMIMQNSQKVAYNFAIKRGTVIQLSNDIFLLWTHGCVMHDELAGINRNYYKNKRGIPKPLLIKRFYGKANGDTIVKEIMMLTKMNWNSGDNLYKELPVTLDFAKILSRMAKQKEALYDKPYDFRYFM